MVLIAVAVGLLLSRCAKTPAGGAEGGQGVPGGAGGGGGGRGGGGGGGPPITVGVATATLGPMPIEISALGTVTSLETVNVIPRVSGALEKVAFKEGQIVRAGQLLAVIDPRPFQVALDQARATQARDEALLASAKVDLNRYATLHASDSIAGQTYDTQVALVRQDEATVAADKANTANAKLNLSFCSIVSPTAGRVGLRQVDPGNQISANQATPVAVVTKTDPISVVFALPESDIGQVVSHHGGVGLQVTAYDRAGGVALAHGSLASLDSQIDTTTGTVKAKATFANPQSALFPNQFVNVTLLVETLQNQVIVPTTATRHGPKGDFVWVVEADKTVKSQPVTVGPGSAEAVSIVAGLTAGETVVTDGGDRLRQGAKVRLPQTGGRGPGAAPAAPGAAHGHGAGTGHHHAGAPAAG